MAYSEALTMPKAMIDVFLELDILISIMNEKAHKAREEREKQLGHHA